jgi:acetyl-CoA C-acetyltransferase
VFNAMDALGLRADDPRRLTLTGGLPFFGGPGNNYSMHALAEVVQRCRAEPGSLGLVGANGGLMSVHAVGVYGTTPRAYAASDDRALQRQLDAAAAPPFTRTPDGWATVETYTVLHDRQGPKQLLLVGRLAHSGERFIAVDGDAATLQAFADGDGLPLRVWVWGAQGLNRASLQRPARAEAQPNYRHVQVARQGRVLEVTLNRPDHDHALTPEAHDELEAVFDGYEADPSLWVAILTGAGTRAFCAGQDLADAASGRRQWLPRSGFGGLTARPQRLKPVIAAVNGLALDGGFELALACDLIVADETARFALQQPRSGAVAEHGGVQRLLRRLPAQAAMGLLLTGREIGAAEARGMGLVNEVVPAGTALDGARRWAAQIEACSPVAVRATRALAQAQAAHASEADAVQSAYPAIDRHLASDDRLEGLAARGEGRSPQWRNR